MTATTKTTTTSSTNTAQPISALTATTVALHRYLTGMDARVSWHFFFFQAEDGIRDLTVTGVQTCALPILAAPSGSASGGLAGFGAAMFAALWAYSGWQYLPMAAGEVQDPQRNLPRAIIGGSLLGLATYPAPNHAYP